MYAAELQRSIYSRVGDLALAEDLTSTVFLKALRWLREDQSLESARGWLYATARTTIVDYWQEQSQYEIRSLSGLEALPFTSEGAEYVDQQSAMRVQHLLGLLPERDRSILTLRYLQGYSAAEIAETLGTSASHIRVLQLRALRRAAQIETRERNRSKMQEKEAPFDAFARFMTAESRRALDLAREEMLKLNQWWIGTEHLLWGLASEGSLTAFLAPLSITPERIDAGLIFIFDRQTPQSQLAPGEGLAPDVSADALTLLTPRAKQTIVLAKAEAKNQGETNIRPVHLLLGLMNEGEGLGAGLLRSLGFSLSQARTALLAPPAANQICSFCGRGAPQANRFFPAENGEAESSTTLPGVFICDQCVRRFHTMLGTASK